MSGDGLKAWLDMERKAWLDMERSAFYGIDRSRSSVRFTTPPPHRGLWRRVRDAWAGTLMGWRGFL